MNSTAIKRNKISLRIPLLLWLTLIGVNAWPSSLKVDLTVGAPIRIPINLDKKSLLERGAVHAQLGAYDIVSLLTVESDTIYFHHHGSVEPGNYLLKIHVITEQGKLIIAEKQVTFYSSQWVSSTQFSGAGSYEVDAEQNQDFATNIQKLSELALRSQASLQAKNLSFTVGADFQQRSDGNTLSGKKLEIPHFVIGAEHQSRIGTFGLAIGNQRIEQNGLVFSGFDRRGIAAEFRDNRSRYGIRFFHINTDPEISSKDNILVAGDKEERSSGLVLNFSPIRDNPEHLSINAGYIDGQSLLQGIGLSYLDNIGATEEERLSYGGEAWFVGASSVLLNQSLVIDAEKAESTFDSDGFGIGESSRFDDAKRYSIKINSNGDLNTLFSGFNAQHWEIYYLTQKVGRDFYSLANLGLPGDLATDQTGLKISWSQVQLSLSAVEVKNNIDKLTYLPTQTTDQTQALVNYQPTIKKERYIWSVVGQPTLSLQLSQTERIQDIEDALLTGYDLNDETYDHQVSVGLQKATLGVSVQLGETKFNNNAASQFSDGTALFEPSSDTENRFTALSLNYYPNEQFSISPTLQKSRFEELGTGGIQEDLNYSIQAYMSVFNDRLQLHLNHNFSKQESVFFGTEQEYESQQSSFVLNWLAIKARNRNAGLKLSLKNTWNRLSSGFVSPQTGYQVLLGLDVYWSAGESQ